MDLPILTNVLSQRRRESLVEAIEVVERCLAAKSIPNSVYQDLKHVVARCIEEGWRRAVFDRYVNPSHYNGLPLEVKDLLGHAHPELHTVNRLLRRAEAVQSEHACHRDMLAYLHEIVPLADAVNALKGFAVKREIKPKADIPTGYQPPPVRGEAQAKVLALLESVTEASRDDLHAWFVKLYSGYLEKFIAADAAAQDAGSVPLSPYSFFNNDRRRNPEACAIVEATTHTAGHGRPYLKRSDADDRIARKAETVSEMVRMDFVHKNFAKIASIVDRKGNFVEGEVLGHSLDLSGFRGSLRFSFEDGSRFTVRNSVVWSTSVRGKLFRRFPLVFSNAILPDGSRLLNAHEETMNTVFAVAQAKSPKP